MTLLLKSWSSTTRRTPLNVLVIGWKAEQSADVQDRNGINTGWWISKNTMTGSDGREEVLQFPRKLRMRLGGPGMAWNGRDTKGPPTGGWFVIRDRQKLPDPAAWLQSGKSSAFFSILQPSGSGKVNIIDPKQANDDALPCSAPQAGSGMCFQPFAIPGSLSKEEKERGASMSTQDNTGHRSLPPPHVQARHALEQLDGNKLKGRLQVKDKPLSCTAKLCAAWATTAAV